MADSRQKIDSITSLTDPNIGIWIQQLVTVLNEYLTYNFIGTGSPEGVVTASTGAVYHNKSGGTGVSIYVKETGTGNTGWVAK